MFRTLFFITILILITTNCAKPPDISGIEVENIIIIIVDTLRADHLGFMGYHRDTSPNIDSLAEKSIVFEEAYTAQSSTGPSFSSLFTGQHTLTTHVHGNMEPWPEDMNSLVEIFEENGFNTYAIIAAGLLAPEYGFSRGFTNYNCPQQKDQTLKANEIWDIYNRLTLDEPFFLLVHFFDPHFPYVAPPESFVELGLNPSYSGPAGLENGGYNYKYLGGDSNQTPYTARDLQRTCDTYDAEIRYTDGYVGKVLDKLQAEGYYDNSIVILTADHGEALGELRLIGHGWDTEEQLHIPLTFHLPNNLGAGYRTTGLIQNTDIIPTALDLLDIPIPQIDGISFADQLLEDRISKRDTLLSVAGSSQFSLWDGFWRRTIDVPEIDEPEHELTPQEIETLRSLGYIR